MHLGNLDRRFQLACSPFKGALDFLSLQSHGTFRDRSKVEKFAPANAGVSTNHRHYSARWRAPAGFLDCMGDVTDISSSVHASSGGHGGCHVHLSWHEHGWSTPKARRGPITV